MTVISVVDTRCNLVLSSPDVIVVICDEERTGPGQAVAAYNPDVRWAGRVRIRTGTLGRAAFLVVEALLWADPSEA